MKIYNKRPFSLIELIVMIIVIFSIAFVFIIPHLAKVKKRPRTRCLNNLRQIIMGCISYSDTDLKHGYLPYDSKSQYHSLYLLYKHDFIIIFKSQLIILNDMNLTIIYYDKHQRILNIHSHNKGCD